MGFCVYFHRTWTPGYNSEIIDPNLAYSYQRKLNFAKKIAWWMFISTLIACVILLLVTLSTRTHQQKGADCNNQTIYVVNTSQGGNEVFDNLVPVAEQRVQQHEEQHEEQHVQQREQQHEEQHVQQHVQQREQQHEEQHVQQREQQHEKQIGELEASIVTCPVGHFKCQMTGNCTPISAFCDGVYDCGYDDPTDEPEPENCTCRYYLELAAPQSICHLNGKSRCPDRSDQLNCPCGLDDSFVCDQQSRECVHKNLVCDSVKDCSNGLDEALCTAVSSTLANITMDRSKRVLEGYVLVRIRGSWHPYCSNKWSVEMAEEICQFLGYETLADLQVLNLEELNHPPNDPSNNTSTEDDNLRRLWIYGKSRNAAIDSGSVDDVVLEAKSGEGIECNAAYVKCSKI